MDLHDLIHLMPKVELHIHLEGAIEAATLLQLAERNGVALPASTVEGLRAWYSFRDFEHFVEVYMTIQRCLRSADDFSLITYELGAGMAQQNIRYREITVTPYTHLIQDKGLVADDIITGLEDGRRRARRDFGVEMRWVLDIHRNLPLPATAEVTAQLVLDWADRGVVALGLGGNEATAPSPPFAPYFQRVKAAGLHSAPHAGENAGPDSIWSALRDLQADRIGHGVRSALRTLTCWLTCSIGRSPWRSTPPATPVWGSTAASISIPLSTCCAWGCASPSTATTHPCLTPR
jgi:aminodeoxyfutalosine deaminase